MKDNSEIKNEKTLQNVENVNKLSEKNCINKSFNNTKNELNSIFNNDQTFNNKNILQPSQFVATSTNQISKNMCTSKENLDLLHSDLNISLNNLNNDNLITSKPNRETYKNRKKIYQQEKKKLAEQLLTTLNDPTVLVLADWLKVRATLKTWTKVWCELRPGLLVIYKSPKVHKSGQWIGTVLLNICNVIERPSKKDGFCFKLFNPLEQNIWATKGPKGESFGALTLPLPLAYLMFRATSQQNGIRWIQAINLSFKCSKKIINNDLNANYSNSKLNSEVLSRLIEEDDINVLKDEQEIEKHFINQDLTDDQNSSAEHEYRSTDSDTTGPIDNDYSYDKTSKIFEKQLTIKKRAGTIQSYKNSKISSLGSILEKSLNQSFQSVINLENSEKKLNQNQLSTNDQLNNDSFESLLSQTEYIYQPEEQKFSLDEQNQTEEVGEENKSLLWSLLKQVRPGMDLSKVVLPTFILEPRSFLEKLTDYYYHSDILANTTTEDDPFERMKGVVKWYLSGFYKKPDGLKKPYNPVLGECYRCYWEHPENDNLGLKNSSDHNKSNFTRTYYVAEQISHHPPMSAFHVANRKLGYSVGGVVCVRSRYYGNSVSAILEGNIRLTLINRGEDYIMTMPYAHCKGILLGGLTFELGGKVEIKCERTGYSTELEFKLKPFLGGEMNVIYGKIKLGKETIASIEGHWDKKILIKEKRTGEQSILWEANTNTIQKRLKRYVVPTDKQNYFESTRLWSKVSEAILNGDQRLATAEKTILEEKQRQEAKLRLENNEDYQTKFFHLNERTNEWYYKYEDVRPWDFRTDIIQYEKNFIIQTLTKHRTISKTSLNSLNNSFYIENSPTIRKKASNITINNLTPIKANCSPTNKSKNNSKTDLFVDQNIKFKKIKKNELNFIKNYESNIHFDSIDGDEDTDIEIKNNLSLKNKNFSNRILFKKIEQNEIEFRESLASLMSRQQKIEKLLSSQVLDEKKVNKKISFFSLPNAFFVVFLTIIVQLIIYKFNVQRK